uniref:Uncharacterized protein n=1 Tax=Sciurus vulgaris TaxID=55149 RepID=A0A8D2BD84_SCIVU
MVSSLVLPATAPVATAGPGLGFGFASKTKKKHFVQQKVKVFPAADPLVADQLSGLAWEFSLYYAILYYTDTLDCTRLYYTILVH